MATRPRAYRVPFTAQRPRVGTYELVNESAEVLHGVSFTLHGAGVMAVSLPRVVRPGYGVEVSVAAQRRSDVILVVRWARADGTEYVWRVPL